MKKINNRLGLFLFFVLLFWAKTILAYYLDFSLGVKGSLQREILWFNPVATTLLLFGFSLYFKKHKTFMISLTLLNVLNTLILYLNIIFYREFTDFITIQSVFGFSKVSEGFSGDLLALMRVHEVFYWLPEIMKFTKQNNLPLNPQYAGIAKGKNVFVIHLESFQQFLINMKVQGQEVTPFLNQLYQNKATISFDNFFHEVGQGKTSDAENMLETGTFGLPQGSLFTQLGSDNTFEAAPAVLGQKGYTTAVFHGNVGSFWNRDHVYKNLGYQYFFDRSYFSKDDKMLGYGILDKQLLRESASELEHLQQPFYAKFLTVTNHTPYYTDDQNFPFPKLNTGNSIVDDYVRTAHYLDQSLEQFFHYLQTTSLYNHSIFVIYGDHFGISDANNKDLCKAFNRDPKTWTNYDNAQLQRVPLMFYMPGYTQGKIMHEYGGEIDVLPTLYHLLGVDDKNYIHFGTDLLSPQYKQVVPFRNGDFVTPQFSYLGGEIYNNQGKKLDQVPADLKAEVTKDNDWVKKSLSLSDKLNQENLLRFYKPQGFQEVQPKDYNYDVAFEKNKVLEVEKQKNAQSTSLFSQNGNQTTVQNYPTTP